MAAEVHDDELIVGDEAAAVGAGSEAVAADLEGGFGNEVGLVLLLDGARVSGGIDEGGEKEGGPWRNGRRRSCGPGWRRFGRGRRRREEGSLRPRLRREDFSLCSRRWGLRDGARWGEGEGGEESGGEDVT